MINLHACTEAPGPRKKACDSVLSHFSCVPTLCNPMDCRPPGFSVHDDSPGQEYWSGLPCPPPESLPSREGIEPASPALVGGVFTTSAPWEAPVTLYLNWNKGCYSACAPLTCWPWSLVSSDGVTFLLFSSPGKILWRRAWQPTPVFLPGESHGQRSLMGP